MHFVEIRRKTVSKAFVKRLSGEMYTLIYVYDNTQNRTNDKINVVGLKTKLNFLSFYLRIQRTKVVEIRNYYFLYSITRFIIHSQYWHKRHKIFLSACLPVLFEKRRNHRENACSSYCSIHRECLFRCNILLNYTLDGSHYNSPRETNLSSKYRNISVPDRIVCSMRDFREFWQPIYKYSYLFRIVWYILL